jgi:uncharacterized repeat protein (TIGR01451 family)
VTYTLIVSNAGPDAATGVEVTDKLSSLVTFVSATASQGAYDAASGVWTVGTVGNGAQATLLIAVDLPLTVDAPASLVNTAEITHADQPDPDSTPNNGTPSSGTPGGPALPPEDDNPWTPVVFTPFEPMTTTCFAARFNFAKPRNDQLLFLGSVALPADFRAAGQTLDFNLSGFRFSCTLDAKGRYRSDTAAGGLRRVRDRWRLDLRVNREDLQSHIQSAVDADVRLRSVDPFFVTVKVNGKTYATQLAPLYSATRGRTGKMHQ